MRRSLLVPLGLLLGCPSEPPPDLPPVALDVVVNEFQADNRTTLPDELGAFPDWIELFNAGDASADLTGHSLSDDLDAPRGWMFPAGTTIAAGDYLVVRASRDGGDGLHAPFGLSAAGEAIGLFAPIEHGSVAIDALTFGSQAPDQAMSRLPDGAEHWEQAAPSPGTSNQ